MRPSGNFRKFSLQLGGKAEANAHITLAPLSASSSKHWLAPDLLHQHQPARGTGPGLRKEAPSSCPRLHHSRCSCLSGSESLIISETLRNITNMLRRTYKVGSRLRKVNIFLFRWLPQLLWYLLQRLCKFHMKGLKLINSSELRGNKQGRAANIAGCLLLAWTRGLKGKCKSAGRLEL